MGELQDRRDAQTRAELSEAAIALFAERGFVQTTMTEVAAAAGVSRRTAYRHFANKEDLLFEQSGMWMEVFNSVVARAEPEESTKSVCKKAVVEVARHIEEHRAEVLAGYGVVAATPELHSRYARTNREWLERYNQLIRADIAESDRKSSLQAGVLAGALVGGTDSSVIQWWLDPDTSLVGLIEDVLKHVEPLWPKESLIAGRSKPSG